MLSDQATQIIYFLQTLIAAILAAEDDNVLDFPKIDSTGVVDIGILFADRKTYTRMYHSNPRRGMQFSR